MGFKDWVRKHLGWFDRQIENYPTHARTPRPPSGPPPVRTAPPPPPRARHRLDETRRRPDSDTDVDPGFGGTIASAEPRWIDVPPEHHDHRHHGGGPGHGPVDTGSTNIAHHGGHHGHQQHDSGSWGGHQHGGFDGGGHHGGGYDGGSASCGSGGD